MRLQDITCSLGDVVDLSAGGARVRLRGRTPDLDERCVLHIHGLDQVIELEIRIRWCRRVGLLGREIGVEFVDVAPAARSALALLARTAAHNETIRPDIDRFRNSA